MSSPLSPVRIGDLGWDSRLAGGEFGAFLTGVPSEPRIGERARDCGGEDREVQGVKCKVSDSVE